MTDTNFGEYAAQMESDLNHYRTKSDADDEMITLLKRQLEMAEMQNSQQAADHAEEARGLRQQRDKAVRERKEIKNILDVTVAGIVAGMRKIEGDATPPKMPSQQAAERDHPGLPRNELPVPPEVTAFAPPPLRLARPAVGDPIDDGLREIVGGLERVHRR